ncbi:MAG: UDP-N-acetylmuramate--L-alanine ligase [Bacteroidota bacterium]
MKLDQLHSIYFLGIGGIGMSALARYFHLRGVEVRGYDRVESVVTRQLEELGIQVYHEMSEEHPLGADLMVYTPAISQEAVEYQAALSAGIPIHKRSVMLGWISESYQCLAVAGTHGKTTTSSMLAHLLQATGGKPTAFLGGIARNLNSNFTFGTSSWLVVEADEYDRSFLTLHPKLAIITSLDPDHLDIYGSAEAMQDNYLAFASQCERLLVHADLQDVDWPKPCETFGIEKGDVQARNLRYEALSTYFDFVGKGVELLNLRLPFPGKHNVLNMTAALAAAIETGASAKELGRSVEAFAGIYRRFEVHVQEDSLCYVDDYAHHPSEIAAVIDTARNLYPDWQLMVVFQPHLFSRTKDFAPEFAGALSLADRVWLMDIYPAREVPIAGVDSELILSQMTLEHKALVSREALIPTIKQHLQPETMLMTLGAGDIDKEVPRLAEALTHQPNLS